MAYPYTQYPQYPQPGYGQSYQPQMPNIPVMQQPGQQVQQNSQGFSQASRPVASVEEAMGIPADFSGAPMIFPDITHDQVYVKRWNMQTGSADFAVYTRNQQGQQSPAQQPQVFASVDELNDLKGLVEKLQTEIDKMKKNGKGGKKDDAE